jgi:hypothetical protein
MGSGPRPSARMRTIEMFTGCLATLQVQITNFLDFFEEYRGLCV